MQLADARQRLRVQRIHEERRDELRKRVVCLAFRGERGGEFPMDQRVVRAEPRGVRQRVDGALAVTLDEREAADGDEKDGTAREGACRRRLILATRVRHAVQRFVGLSAREMQTR